MQGAAQSPKRDAAQPEDDDAQPKNMRVSGKTPEPQAAQTPGENARTPEPPATPGRTRAAGTRAARAATTKVEAGVNAKKKAANKVRFNKGVFAKAKAENNSRASQHNADVAASAEAAPSTGTVADSAVVQALEAATKQLMLLSPTKGRRQAFGRSISSDYDPRRQEGEKRTARGEKCPEHIVMQMQSKADKDHWYHIWLQNGGHWARAEARESKSTKTAEGGKTVVKWMTLDQLKDHYKSEVVAQNIKARKCRQPEMRRPHPEIPDCLEAEQFKCFLSETEATTWEEAHKKKVEVSAELDSDAAMRLMDSMAPAASSLAPAASSSSPAPRVPTATPPLAPASTDESKDEELEALKKAAEEARIKKAAEAQKLVKEAERKKKEKEERDRKREEDKEAKKHCPLAQADKWVSGVNNYLGQLLSLRMDAENDKSAKTTPIRTLYISKFQAHEGTLKKIRKTIENLRGKGDSEKLKTELTRAQGIAEEIKDDMKAYKAASTSYKGKAKAKAKAKHAATEQ